MNTVTDDTPVRGVPVPLHRYLLDAQDMRYVGDYGIGPSITRQQLAEILANTEEFLMEVERAL